ncbi:MAG: hypothetical protein ACPGPF_00025 [Pontibacterium sp.]
MTTTTNPPIGNTWTAVADSNAGDEAVTIQNPAQSQLEYAISAEALSEDAIGIKLNPNEKALFAGFTGVLYLRYSVEANDVTVPVIIT